MIRIGANPICWSNDDMQEIGGDIPLEQCLAEAKAIGIEGMELGNKFPRTPAALKPILDAFKLDLVSGWYSTFLIERNPETEFEAARPHVELLKALGAKVLIAAECTRTIHGTQSAPLSTRPVMTDAEWDRFNAGLTRFAEMLAEEGLTLVYHHHMGTVVQTEAEIDRMMAGTGPAVHLLLDTGHITWAGGDPVALARRYSDRIAHVHTKDVRPAIARQAIEEDWSFLNSVLAGVYTVPGDGAIDYVAVFREIPDYSGWIVIEAEQDPVKAPPLQYVQMGFDNLNRFIDEAGLKR
ncbi:myo-inosose-2 dehydratase [Kaistia dalseonensis]|uniref:Myo-inosose-2 dehydratase n=1 Tax=Kaistia dalseonensis TaxID=410840 RepID=A0ABU0HC17_9HYPH|nr:myo-inosose-2 dehydratase [Kaistia dalseonensis]MCX5497223.1 myo-inosose-2 dehydratase [Kaistia dalseonensis]MDQ0439854.1 myo-inosose-2 dehydratase [Kaistia dalseonensis]